MACFAFFWLFYVVLQCRVFFSLSAFLRVCGKEDVLHVFVWEVQRSLLGSRGKASNVAQKRSWTMRHIPMMSQ